MYLGTAKPHILKPFFSNWNQSQDMETRDQNWHNLKQLLTSFPVDNLISSTLVSWQTNKNDDFTVI
jgi:hypothetical protein